jgi:tRNA(adenine34) deaminase
MPVSDADFMHQALQLAAQAQQNAEVPVGAILVLGDQVIATGRNRPIASHDPTAHAEIEALRAGGRALGSYRLNDTTLYVTLEPCAMCAAAISFARLRRLYFAASDPKGGAVEHGPRFFGQPTCHHRPEVYGGLDESRAAELLTRFFRERR